MIKAQVIKDSVSQSGIRLTTMQLRYHRFIHAELMTHRMFSRNASSSRAIPVKKMIEIVEKEIAMPLSWGSNQKGMQAGQELDHGLRVEAARVWLEGAKHAIATSKELADLGVHKQIANRPIESYSFITVVLTGTAPAYANFFALRNHKDAQPEIQALAKEMTEAYYSSKPEDLAAGAWHLPYVTDGDLLALEGLPYETQIEILCKVSTARCARVSYMKHDNSQPSISEDMDLYQKLVGSKPIHASPAEHQAMSLSTLEQSGNFHGWLQYRKTLPGEYVQEFK